MSKINYLGKRKNGTVQAVAGRLGVSVADVYDMKAHPIRYIINEKTGDISKINIHNSPLLIREFGVKKINNDKLINGGLIKKDIIVSKSPIPLSMEITGTIWSVVRVEWNSSGHIYDKIQTINVEKEALLSIQDVNQQILEKYLTAHPSVRRDVRNQICSVRIRQGEGAEEGSRYVPSFGNEIDLHFITRNDVKLEFSNMVLKGKAFNLCRIYGEDVDLNKTNEDNCVLQVMRQMYKKIGAKSFEEYNIRKDGATAQDIKRFCERFRIKLTLFNISGEEIIQHEPIEPNKSYGQLCGIVYNNHFYKLKNPHLRKVVESTPTKLIFCEKLQDKLIELYVENGEYPNYVGMYNGYISSIQVGETVYHNNKDYDFCLEILTKLGIGSHMTFQVNKQNIHKVIEPLFLKTNVESFFPSHSLERGYNYVNKEFDEKTKTISIDHNKHFSDALRSLKSLVKIDIKTCKHIMNPTKLEDGYFYIAKPLYSSVLMEKTGFYPYDHLKFCEKEGVAFELLEAISCEQIPNYYTDMINTLYEKLDNESFKFVVNCMIGSFEKKADIRTEMKFVKLANKDETEASEGFVKKLNDEYNMIYDVEEKRSKNPFNKVPIRVQTLCKARRIVYEKVKELKLKPKDIKQIRCDSITFKYTTKKIKLGEEIGEWKMQDSKVLAKDLGDEEDDEPITFKLNPINSNNKIYIDYAGSGKTHHIMNELIPKLDDFIVVSPSHASIREYRTNKKNCNVVQRYSLSHTIPTENNIIVDEIGMLDAQANNILIKCAMLGKNIYSFGDFKQLPPVQGERCNSDIYLNYLYGEITKLGTNYRNDFTFEYYDKLIAMTKMQDILAEINKYNAKSYDEAETIITYTNATRQKYNKKMITKLKIDYNIIKGEKYESYTIKTPTVGCKIVCHSNDLAEQNIFNNFYYKIKSVDGNTITITDEVTDINVSLKQLLKYFGFGYCRTLYNIQGETLSSFYFPVEDINYIDGHALYTLISRLKK